MPEPFRSSHSEPGPSGGAVGGGGGPGEQNVKISMRVGDLHGYLDQAEQLGGRRLVPPTGLPGDADRFAIFTDPDAGSGANPFFPNGRP
jgi:hypothetical protein